MLRKLVVAGLTAVLLATSASTQASPGDKVPTLAKVMQIFPEVTERDVSTGQDFEVQQDCLNFSVAAHPKKSIRGDYPGPGFPGPGGPPPAATVLLYIFKNSHQARQALKKVKDYTQGCSGTHADATYTYVVSSLTNPHLADRSVAYSSSDSYVMPPSNIRIGRTRVHVVVQRDDRVIDAYYDTQGAVPDVASVTKLAKAALQSSA